MDPKFGAIADYWSLETANKKISALIKPYCEESCGYALSKSVVKTGGYNSLFFSTAHFAYAPKTTPRAYNGASVQPRNACLHSPGHFTQINTQIKLKRKSTVIHLTILSKKHQNFVCEAYNMLVTNTPSIVR